MTGFKSKKAAALDEDGMYLVHQTAQQDATMQSLKDLKRSVCDEVGKAAFAQPVQKPVEEDDDTQVYGDALTIAYQSGYHDGKKAALAGREWNFCERCGKRTADLTVIHTCTPPQKSN